MAEHAGEMKVEVLVFPDGGTQVSMPSVEDHRRAPLLEAAAHALRRAADHVARDLEPVTCGQCGVTVTAVRASVDGSAHLAPCGHATT